MHFRAVVGENPKTVDVVFGKETDVKGLARWRAPKNSPFAVRDAVEFALLASKRWRYYRKSISSLQSLHELRDIARMENPSEACMILVAKASWFSRTVPLGVAQCRRTYCNHLVLEFLSAHPKVVAGVQPQIRGVGSGLVLCLAALAVRCGIEEFWGEATLFSAPFYAKTLGLGEVKDHFHAGPRDFARGAEKFTEGGGVLESLD